MSTELQFFLAGEVLEVSEVDPTLTLLDYLRDHRALTGTKEGCNEGDCGACTVLLGNYEPLNECIVYRAVNACITLLPAVHRHWVVTVEDLSDEITNLHPVQDAMVKRHGSQCGFCTPGILVASKALLEKNPDPSEEEVRYWLAGNLCRCTGYDKIIRAVMDAAEEMRGAA